ncbi:hypothetical protein AGLY_016117 [Aphis glycines]|uniref:Uncharacterized protein n=1 Tax=Aphis glycines TaxID=307491 RepID=A0A6G0SZP0_APHGL|nr:hypothetical protein AGLY_016117 [Aphis glycines]
MIPIIAFKCNLPSPRSTPPPNVQQSGTHLPAFSCRNLHITYVGINFFNIKNVDWPFSNRLDDKFKTVFRTLITLLFQSNDNTINKWTVDMISLQDTTILQYKLKIWCIINTMKIRGKETKLCIQKFMTRQKSYVYIKTQKHVLKIRWSKPLKFSAGIMSYINDGVNVAILYNDDENMKLETQSSRSYKFNK